jgi:glutamyl-tRNA reductase
LGESKPSRLSNVSWSPATIIGNPLTDEIYTLAEPGSLEHLFKVASGSTPWSSAKLKSSGQLKKAYDLALKYGHTGSRLNKAFPAAHSTSPSSFAPKRTFSVAVYRSGSVAVELARRSSSSLASKECAGHWGRGH